MSHLRVGWFLCYKRPLLARRLVTGSTIAIVGLTAQAAMAQVPAAPALNSVTQTTSKLTPTWSAVSGATSYNLYRATSPGGEGTSPFMTGITTTNYADTTVTNGIPYYYKVSGVNGSGEGALSVERSGIPLAVPSSVAATPGNGAVTLSWGSVTAATSYNIYRSTTAGTETLLTSAGNALSYTDTSVSNGSAYFYKVTAVISNLSDESAKSSEVSASPAATLPTAPSLAAVPGSSTIALSWNSVGGTSGYNVKRATAAGGPYTTISSATSTTFTDTPPLTTATYYYVVTAVAGTAESANSNEMAASCAGGIAQSATADAYTLSSQPTRNLGSTYFVSVSGTAGQEAFLTFPVSAGGAITSAVLKIYKYTGAADTQTVYGISPSSWTESGITWNTQPSLTGATTVGTLSVTTANQYYTLDVTSYVQQQIAAGATSVSFAITSAATGQIPYYARENGSNTPQLVLNVTAPAVATGLTATPGDAQVLLTWNPLPNATGYNVYRSTTSGSGYAKITTIAPSVANAYLDGSRTNGSTYYYIVKAIIGGTEGGSSSQASATPLVQDANWTITQPSATSLPDPVTTANTAAFSVSQGTTLLASALCSGATTSQISTQASANCSGTWTFTWTGSSWPTLYVIQHVQKQTFSASIDDGNGSAIVKNTGGSTIVSAVFPVTGATILATPITADLFNTADLSAPILTTTMVSHAAGPMTPPGTTTGSTTGWSETISNLLIGQTAYTTQYFQRNFASPSAIVIQIPVSASDITVSSNLSNSASDASASAVGNVSDIYNGQ